MEAKTCNRCDTEKPIEEFNKNPKMADGRLNQCRVCQSAAKKAAYCPVKNREVGLRNRYDITPTDYDRMLEQQGGACRICGLPESANRYARLFVDHNHQTGAVRSLLCSECNAGLGKFQDDPRRLRAASDYLEDHGS